MPSCARFTWIKVLGLIAMSSSCAQSASRHVPKARQPAGPEKAAAVSAAAPSGTRASQDTAMAGAASVPAGMAGAVAPKPDPAPAQADPMPAPADSGKSTSTQASYPSPGKGVYDLATLGAGECKDASVGDVIAKIATQHPNLATIKTLSTPDLGDNGDLIFAYQRPDGGFALTFVHGEGDCFLSCIDHEYWYFETRSACEPEQVGHYKRFSNDRDNCAEQEGTAMWGNPEPLDPMYACGASKAAEAIAGSYRFHAKGTHQPCALSGEQLQVRTIDTTITIDVVQDSAMPAQGSVTVNGLDHPRIDGRKLPAEFTRKRFTAHVVDNNLPSKCIQNNMLDVSFDFEGFGAQSVTLAQVETPDCDQHPDDYCKGSVDVVLTKLD